MTVKISKRAKKRKRRIINLFDCIGNVASFFTLDAKDLTKLIFSNIDAKGSMVDTIIWDIGYFYYDSYKPVMKRWLDNGDDIIQMIIDKTKQRGLECMVNYRMNRVAYKPARLSYDDNPAYPWEKHPYENTDLNLKVEHPDWCLKTWWNQPMFNYENKQLREFVINEITGLMKKYDFDGLLLDFSRHVPVLPPGEQWLKRDCLTDMLKKIKNEFTKIEETDKSILLSAKVPSCEEGCKIDGFDVKTWVNDGLVDLLVLGSRTMDVDIGYFKRLVNGTGIKIYPCIDDHHATDGYRSPGLEWFCGLIDTWLKKGADGFTVFNFSAADPDVYAKYNMVQYGIDPDHKKVLQLGEADKIKFRDKKYVIERKWGYPWSEGFFNQNKNAPLPVYLSNSTNSFDGHNVFKTKMYVSDDIKKLSDKVKTQFSVVYQKPLKVDSVGLKLNGVNLKVLNSDREFKDPQITDYKDKKPVSGGTGRQYKKSKDQKLIKVFYQTDFNVFEHGNNFIEIKKVDTDCKDIKIEKIELEVFYK